MNSDYKKGLQKAITECKKLHKGCVANISNCLTYPYYTKNALVNVGFLMN